jgi:hypothetical protein
MGQYWRMKSRYGYPGSRGFKINLWLKAAIDSSSRANQFKLGSDPDSLTGKFGNCAPEISKI